MEIHRPQGSERSQAISLIGRIISEASGFSDKSADRISDLLKEQAERFEMFCVSEDGIRSVIVYEPETYNIILLGTEAESRRKGYASALLDTVRMQASEKNKPRIFANVWETSLTFFEHYGFEKKGEPSDVFGIRYVPVEYLLQKEYIGRTVTVTIDRPYGSFHPHQPDVIYPLNYGYVDEMISEDGEFQDAYVFGPKEPLESFTGVVAGIIYHKDGPCRFIVTRIGEEISREEIIQAVAFEEQYYDTRLIWSQTQS